MSKDENPAASTKVGKMSISSTIFVDLIPSSVRPGMRVSVQGVKSLGGHFACLCRGFEFYEVEKRCYYFAKRKWKYFYIFNHFYSEKSSKRAK